MLDVEPRQKVIARTSNAQEVLDIVGDVRRSHRHANRETCHNEDADNGFEQGFAVHGEDDALLVVLLRFTSRNANRSRVLPLPLKC